MCSAGRGEKVSVRGGKWSNIKVYSVAKALVDKRHLVVRVIKSLVTKRSPVLRMKGKCLGKGIVY